MVLNLAFVGSLMGIGFTGPHMGLALASSAAAYINAGLLYRMLRRQGAYRPEPGWGRVLFAVGLACAAMTAVLLWQQGPAVDWAQAAADSRAMNMVILIAIGVAVYALALLAAGLRPRHFAKGST
jgi:putative peptidoglycan lipid II flippase